MNYSDYIRNKRVIIVGPSPILKGIGLRDYIESFDVIIKTGNSANINNEDYYSDYGKRIDVLYMNTSFCRDLKEIPYQNWIDKGIKYLRMRFTEAKQYDQLKDLFYIETIPLKLIQSIFPDSLALMGSIIVKECLEYGANEIHITGMDFNTSRGDTIEKIDLPDPGNYSEYIDGYLLDSVKNRMEKIRQSKTKDCHDHIDNAIWMKKLYNEKKLFMQDFILDKLNLLLSMRKDDATV